MRKFVKTTNSVFQKIDQLDLSALNIQDKHYALALILFIKVRANHFVNERKEAAML